MAEAKPTLTEWRKLYHAAIRLKEIAPWQWMTETDIFGVQNPETRSGAIFMPQLQVSLFSCDARQAMQ